MQESFGTRFHRLRKAAGLTQEDVASHLNITPQAISKWENDINAPDISALPALAELFHISTDELLGRERAVVYVPPKDEKDFNRLMLRMRVLTDDNTKVNINLPLALVRIVLQSGGDLSQFGGDSLRGIDIAQIIALAEQGVLGKLMEVESDNCTVEIWVE